MGKSVAGDFKFNVADCDVKDKETLQEYRQKRNQWVNWLEHDESHAILPLIHNMAWNDVAFRFLARVAEQDASSPLRNSLIAESIIDGYFATQTLAIRRLTDKRPKEDVISLRRLVADVKQHEYLLTRENYVSHDGLPYDYEEAERRVWRSREGGGPFWGSMSGPEAYSPSRRAHEHFDQLVGVSPERRSRTECIPSVVLDRISRWIDEPDINELVTWTHKFLAHSADLHSRRMFDLASTKPTLPKITNAIRCLACGSEAIASLFGSGLGELVPVAQFDRYEFLGPVMQSEANREVSDRYWDSLVGERNAFLDNVLEALVSSPAGQGTTSLPPQD